VDVDLGLGLSGQVDGPGLPICAAAVEHGRFRAGRQLGTLAHIPGADGMDRRRFSSLPYCFPVVGQKLITSRPGAAPTTVVVGLIPDVQFSFATSTERSTKSVVRQSIARNYGGE
jgi:hypothetical protein